jgi:hypothetical protein
LYQAELIVALRHIFFIRQIMYLIENGVRRTIFYAYLHFDLVMGDRPNNCTIFFWFSRMYVH